MSGGKSRRLAGYFADPPPRVLAHRGLALEAPENTLHAFAAAISLGVTHIETDVHVSADGVAVIAHDPDLRRVAGRDVRVEQLTSRELAKIDLGDGQGFCTLAEALDAFPETYFNIDIKVGGAAAPAAAAIRKVDAVSRVLIASFSGKNRRAVVRELPGIATSLSMDKGPQALIAAKTGAVALLRRVLRGIDAVQLPYELRGIDVLTERTVRSFHAAGVEVHAWTVNEVPIMERLLARGVDGLVSDRADLALPLVEAYKSERS